MKNFKLEILEIEKNHILLKNISGEKIYLKSGRGGWKIFDGSNHYFKKSLILEPNEIFYIINKPKIINENIKVTEANFKIREFGNLKIFDENGILLVEKFWPTNLIFLNEIAKNWIEIKYVGNFKNKIDFILKIDNEVLNFSENFNPKEIKVLNLKREWKHLQLVVDGEDKEKISFKEPLAKFDGKWLKTQILTPGLENIYFINFRINENLTLNYFLLIFTPLLIFLLFFLKFKLK